MALDGSEMMKPLLLKLGVAFGLAFSGYLYIHRRLRGPLSRHPKSPGRKTRWGLKDEFRNAESLLVELGNEEKSHKIIGRTIIGLSPRSRNSKGDEGFLLLDIRKLREEQFDVTEFPPTKGIHSIVPKRADEDAMKQEINNLMNMVRELQERERNFEIQLLEYYGLKEQETTVQELYSRLKINAMEAKLLNLKIENLEAENRSLKAQASEYSRLKTDLEGAKAKVKLLKRKMRLNEEQAKEHILDLQQKISLSSEDQDHEAASSNAEVQKMVERVKDLEDELSALVKENSRIHQENSNLTMDLEATQVFSSVSEGLEAQVLEEADQLRKANSHLEEEIEKLRLDHSSDVEELVYLRWVNACLRYELRNYQIPPGKTAATNLSKTLSHKSEEKVKNLILEYANLGTDETSIDLVDFEPDYYSSSQPSTPTATGNFEDSNTDISSDMQNTSSTTGTKKKFFRKLKKLWLKKNQQEENNRLSSAEKTPTSSATSRLASISIGSSDFTMATTSYEGSYPSTEHATSIPHSPSVKSFLQDLGKKEMDAKTNDWKNRTESLSRLSLDIQGLKRTNLEMEGDEGSSSDVGSAHVYKTLRDGDVIDFSPDETRQDQDLEAIEKLELTKFAQVLKSTRQNSESNSPSFTPFCH